ncbi:MAG: 4Fe-4S binding protein [Deltaproteobacteria bacterium]|nr:4Fe-4S binding protein [Deltaproteobacteria bacterium]
MRSTAKIHHPALWYALTGMVVVAGAALPFVVWEGQKFWKLEYIAYLMALLLVPALLLRQETPGTRWIRHIVLLVSLALFGFLQWACPRPEGSIELLLLGLLKDKPVLNFGLKLGVLVGVTALYGRFFCGWICPKGTLQDLVFRPGLAWTVPPRVDRWLKYGKYVALAALIAGPLGWEYRLFAQVGPFKVLFNLDGSTYLVSFLVVVLLVSVFIERAWCRYLCPAGAMLGLIAFFSPTKVRVNEEACIGCTKCAKVCPVNAIEALPKQVPVIALTECHACKACETVCPTSCITLSTRTPVINLKTGDKA